ncbi:hypothetical protein GCM10020000_43300 [Streptomyces olivoverticillatus]
MQPEVRNPGERHPARPPDDDCYPTATTRPTAPGGCPQPVEAAMRWLVGWSCTTTPGPHGPHTPDNPAVHPVGARLLWGDPAPLWAVGDWRPDEVRVVQADPHTRLAVLGRCGASDDALRTGLTAARGGALRHLTAWPGSYTAVAHVGRRLTITADLAGARPVFHTTWAGGTAYATAALPLADLVEAQLDIGHLAALLACPDSPEALGDGTPYLGVRRVPPGHALVLRDGARDITGYEPTASLAVAAPQLEAAQAIDGVRDVLVESVRTRFAAPRHTHRDPGPVPGMGPAHRRAARGAPAPGIGADLTGGSASGTLALLAAGLPGLPGTPIGHGTGAGERLLAVTLNDLAADDGHARAHELERARAIAASPPPAPRHRRRGHRSTPLRRPRQRPAHRRTRPPRSSPLNATADASPQAAPTTSSDTAPAKYLTPTPHASPTCSWTAADATCCALSPPWPGPTAPRRTPSSSPSPSTGPPADWPVRRTGRGWKPRRPPC